MAGIFQRALFPLVLATAACGSGVAPTASLEEAPTSFSFAGRAPSTLSAASPSWATSDTLRSGFDVIVIRRARLVVRQVAIGTTSGVDCSQEPASTRCRALMQDISTIELPLGGMAEQRFALAVPAGAYAQVALELVPAASGEMAGQSIRVEGTFNGRAFAYESNLELRQALELPRPLVIGWSGIITNVTVRVPVTSWFRSATGALLDPSNSARLPEIRGNIARSLRAFEDRDRDGEEG